MHRLNNFDKTDGMFSSPYISKGYWTFRQFYQNCSNLW